MFQDSAGRDLLPLLVSRLCCSKSQCLTRHLHSGLPPIAPLSGEGYMQMREGGWLAYFFQVFFYLLWTQQRGIYADEVGFVKCFQVFPLRFCLNTQISVSNPRQSQRVKLNQRRIFRLNFLNWRKHLTKLPNLFDKIPICIWFCTLQVQDNSWNSISGQFWTQFCINFV